MPEYIDSSLMGRMPFAPFQSCVCCFRGDCTTGLVISGDAEWHIVFTHKLTGDSMELATATVMTAWSEATGHKWEGPGFVFGGEHTQAVRVCESCAEKRGFVVKPLDSPELPCYFPPDHLRRREDG